MGVKQGDNMAGILFLFLIQAMAETLADHWDIETPKFWFHNNTNHARPLGRLIGQPWKSLGTVFELFYFLYVDDIGFLFLSYDELVRGSRILFAHFARFGLIMHIGRGDKASKSEAMFFPRRSLHAPVNDADVATFDVHNGFISFTNAFKHLGCIIIPCLHDDAEISACIRKAMGQLRSLVNVFRANDVPLAVKRRATYIALPLNTVLWGCESWILKAYSITGPFIAFSTSTCLRLRSNEYIMLMREQLSIPDIADYISVCRLNWIGKINRMPSKAIPHRLQAAWIRHPRQGGRPPSNLRHAYVTDLRKVLPDDVVSKAALLSEWTPYTLDETQWTSRIKDWWSTCRPQTLEEPVPAIRI